MFLYSTILRYTDAPPTTNSGSRRPIVDGVWFSDAKRPGFEWRTPPTISFERASPPGGLGQARAAVPKSIPPLPSPPHSCPHATSFAFHRRRSSFSKRKINRPRAWYANRFEIMRPKCSLKPSTIKPTWPMAAVGAFSRIFRDDQTIYFTCAWWFLIRPGTQEYRRFWTGLTA